MHGDVVDPSGLALDYARLMRTAGVRTVRGSVVGVDGSVATLVISDVLADESHGPHLGCWRRDLASRPTESGKHSWERRLRMLAVRSPFWRSSMTRASLNCFRWSSCTGSVRDEVLRNRKGLPACHDVVTCDRRQVHHAPSRSSIDPDSTATARPGVGDPSSSCPPMTKLADLLAFASQQRSKRNKLEADDVSSCGRPTKASTRAVRDEVTGSHQRLAG